MTKTQSTEHRWIYLLFLFYFFGTLGIAVPTFRFLFLPLTPVNLVLTLFIFLKVNNDFSKKFIILSGIIYIIGYGVEAIGVGTGVLFGTYWYGEYFGFKILETPVLIGANWLFLSLSAHGAMQYFTKSRILLIVIPSIIMTGLDFFIEPVAMKLGFWNWADNIVPVQNFVMWFLTSAIIHVLITLFGPKINPKVSFAVLIAQFTFFITLYVFCT